MADPHMPSLLDRMTLRLEPDGAQHHAGVIETIRTELINGLSVVPGGNAGTRLFDYAPLRPFLAPSGPIASVASLHLGPDARAVRAADVQQTHGLKLVIAWHQDRVVAVRKRLPVDGFTNWTIKNGVSHASPPGTCFVG